MSIQHNDSKENGQEAAVPETENVTETPAADSAQTEGENVPAGDDSAPENEKIAERADDEGENEPAETDLNAKIGELEAQLAESRDQLLRKAADFENFRKRMNQEKQNAIEFANQTLLLDIIPVIDDFERAIQSAQSSTEIAELPAGKAMLDGITMIEKRLTSQLETKWGLKRFNSAGEPFDPNRHEAMMMEKSPDVEEPVVQEEYSKGYTLKDRVIRAAQVKVLMPEAE
jgi:molecular chaperone GrpE